MPSGVSVLHHENHASGIIVLAALYNALKLVGKSLKDVRVVINGAGVAGTGVAKGLVVSGNTNIVICDRHGALRVLPHGGDGLGQIGDRPPGGSPGRRRQPAEVIKGRMCSSGCPRRAGQPGNGRQYGERPHRFALGPAGAGDQRSGSFGRGAAVVATGQADSDNQIRSSLVTPGFFRGCLDVGAHRVNIEMYLAAARALADMIPEDKLSPQNIIPGKWTWHISPVIAEAVARAPKETGVAQMTSEVVTPERIHERTESYIYEGELAWLPSEGQDYGAFEYQ